MMRDYLPDEDSILVWFPGNEPVYVQVQCEQDRYMDAVELQAALTDTKPEDVREIT